MDPWSVGNRCGWLSSDKRVGHSVRAAVVLDVQSVQRCFRSIEENLNWVTCDT